MATKKANTPKKDDKVKKVFDVAKPGKTAASASSKPVIIGHKPLLADPMVKADDTSEAKATTEVSDTPTTLAKPSKPKLSLAKTLLPRSNVKIEPLTAEKPDATEAVTTPNTEPQTAPELPAKNSTKLTVKVAAKEAESKVSPKPSKAVETPADSQDEAEAPVRDSEATAREPKESSDTPQTKETAAVDSIANQTEVNEAVRTQVKEAANRQAALEKLITDKKYFVEIGEKKRRRSMRRLLLLLFVVVIGAAATFYILVDSGTIDSSIELPVRFFES